MALETVNTDYAITTTAKDIARPAGDGYAVWTITNVGTSDVFIYANPSALALAALTGTETELKALSTIRLPSLQSVTLPRAASHMGAVAGTGKTSAITVGSGSAQIAGGDPAGGSVTYSQVDFITAGAATTQIMAKVASQTQRIHAFILTTTAAGLVEIEDKDGVVLATWNFGANGGTKKEFTSDVNGTINGGAVNKGLQIVNAAGNLGFYAIVSTG